MSDSQEWQPWSDNPNAPKIPHDQYTDEKEYFAAILIGSILYGILILLFFKCMAALLNPAHRRGQPVKWGLVSYTVVMFSVVTVLTAINTHIQSIGYVDNREFPGVEGLSPGPLGYQLFVIPEALTISPNVMFFLNGWLADGFLLYRCYIVYSMNLWVIAFPCLMYLGSLAMGIGLIVQTAELSGAQWSAVPYFSISLSLNVLLTLMIAIRLILHTRNTRTALGITGVGRLCKAIVTMLIESCALYAVSSLLVVGPWGSGNTAVDIFVSILAEIQVIAPLLIIQRVANKSEFANNTVVSGHLSSFDARARGELTGDSGVLPGEGSTSSVDGRGACPGDLGVEVES